MSFNDLRLLLPVLLLSGCGTAPLSVTDRPASAWLAYAANTDSRYQVYTQKDNNPPQNGCPEDKICTDPQWLGTSHLIFVARHTKGYALITTNPEQSPPTYTTQFESLHPISAVHATPHSEHYTFQSGPLGQEQIYTGALKTSPKAQTTGRYPRVSRQGDRVAYLHKQRICIWALDAGTSQCLTPANEADFSPRWSPDGESLAYLHQRDKGWYLAHMQADGSQRQVLYTAQEALAPAWSPAGKSLAFITPGKFESDTEEAPTQDPEQGLWILPLDSLKAAQVSRGRGYSNPFWLTEDLLFFQASQTGSSNIYRLDVQSQNVTPLTQSEATHLLGGVKTTT